MPVVFGIFLKEVPKLAPIAASVTALVVHFGIYYGRLTSYMQQGTRNPGIASAIAIICSLLVGTAFYFALRKRKNEKAHIHIAADMATAE